MAVSKKVLRIYSEILKRGVELKTRKCNLYITGGIAIVSVIGLVILQFRCYELIGIYGRTNFLSDLRQLGIAIMGGLFTSACVTCLISIGEYKNERTEVLENVYFAAEDLEREFSKITYFIPDEPREIVSNLLGELDNNEQDRKFNKMLSEAVAQFKNRQEADEVYERNCRKLEHDAQNAFKAYIWEHTDERIKEVCREPFQIKEYLDKECAEKIKTYREQLGNSMRSFLRFQKVHTHDIAVAYKRLDFLFANKSIRHHIHEKLYYRLWEEVKLIKEEGHHFNLYFSGKGGNSAVQCSAVWRLQDTLLSEDANWYYRQFDFDIVTEMVQVLVYANGAKNKGEFPQIDEYKLRAKPGYCQRLEEKWEEELKG